MSERKEDVGGRFYDVESSRIYAERPGFRINEIRMRPEQSIPWHCHTNSSDTFYLIEGALRLHLRKPDELIPLAPGDSTVVRPGRPHHVTNGGSGPATFLILQGIGEFDFLPLDS